MLTLHGVRSKKRQFQKGKLKVLQRQVEKIVSKAINMQKMAEQREQIEMSEVIAKAMAEAKQIAIQIMAEMQSRVEETQRGPKIGSPVLKQPQFNWVATDKYSEWKAFMLEVKNVLSTYNTPEHDKIAIVKLVRQKGVALY